MPWFQNSGELAVLKSLTWFGSSTYRPRCRPPTDASPHGTEAGIERRKTVLIVDDNTDACFVMSTILNYDGYQVIVAANGAEGVALTRSELPDIVLMDLRMPVMDGFEAAEILRADAATRHIPIIAVSADLLGGDSRRRADGLFRMHLHKPLESAELETQVRQIIGDP